MKMSISQGKGKRTKDKAFMGGVNFILNGKAILKKRSVYVYIYEVQNTQHARSQIYSQFSLIKMKKDFPNSVWI